MARQAGAGNARDGAQIHLSTGYGLCQKKLEGQHQKVQICEYFTLVTLVFPS